MVISWGDILKETIKTFLLDDNNNIVSEDRATHAINQVFDENGNYIREEFLILNGDHGNQGYKELTNEDYEKLRNFFKR